MNTTKMLPLVAVMTGLLAGCGGSSSSGGGGIPSITYTWQVIDLYKDDRSNIQVGCAIFDNIDDGSGQVIASRVADRNYRILFHNQDGSIDSDKTIEGADIPTTGNIKFKDTDIPENGYVSLEEFAGLAGGQLDSYIFGVQKELMQDMTLAIRTQQASSNSCFKGEQLLEDLTNVNSAITVAANDNPAYYVTSASSANTKGGSQPVGLKVFSNYPAAERKLVTAFSSFISNEANGLTQYAIVPNQNVYDGSAPPSPPLVSVLDGSDVIPHAFTTSDIALSNSGLNVVIDGGIYEWQPLYDSSNTYSMASNESELSHWSLNLQGHTNASTGSWNYASYIKVEGEDILAGASPVSDFSTSNIAACGSSYCINTVGYNQSEFQVQRTSIRSFSNTGNPYYQTIYATPEKSQVILQSASEVISPSSTDVIEIGVVDADIDVLAATEFLMANSMDVNNSVELGSAEYTDFNGLVMLPSSEVEKVKNVMLNNYQVLSNRVN